MGDDTITDSHATRPGRPGVHTLAVLVGVLTFALIAIGGNVTSLGAGMAFPEGWTTGGYWSLLAPLETWWHNTAQFWEHSHRLQGYLVGSVFIALAIVLWGREVWLAKRWGETPRWWLAIVGTVALLLVIGQGVLGAVRVDWHSRAVAFIHGINGQLLLALTVLIAAATSRPWLTLVRDPAQRDRRLGKGMRVAGWGLLAILVLQLVLGAAVRHTNATLAIPDFPTSYGGVLPPMNEVALEKALAPDRQAPATQPAGVTANPDFGYTIMDVHLHFTHRVMAGVVMIWGLALVIGLGAKAPGRRELMLPRVWLVALLLAQVMLGALVIWQRAAPAVATAHQAMGAALLAVATWLAIRIHLVTAPSRQARDAAPR